MMIARFLFVPYVLGSDCYNSDELYSGKYTRPECEPWSEAEWAWPQMTEKYRRDGNYCRQEFILQQPWCYANYLNIAYSSYYKCGGIKMCATEEKFPTTKRAPPTEPPSFESFWGQTTTSTTSSARTTRFQMTTTSTRTTIRTTKIAKSTRRSTTEDNTLNNRGPRPAFFNNERAVQAAVQQAPPSAPVMTAIEILDELETDLPVEEHVSPIVTNDIQQASEQTSNQEIKIDYPEDAQKLTVVINVGEETIMDVIICCILTTSLMVFTILICKGMRYKKDKMSGSIKQMPEEISVMKTKLDTLRDAFVNGSVIAEQEKLGLENISFVTQNEKL